MGCWYIVSANSRSVLSYYSAVSHRVPTDTRLRGILSSRDNCSYLYDEVCSIATRYERDQRPNWNCVLRNNIVNKIIKYSS